MSLFALLSRLRPDWYPTQGILKMLAYTFPDALFYHITREPVVALTIDDIPSSQDPGHCQTYEILAAIAAHNQRLPDSSSPAQATFFMLGENLLGAEALVADLLNQGHEIGNHGFVDESATLLSPEAFVTQFKATDDRLGSLTGQPIRWYRPGRALYNSAMKAVLQQFPSYYPRFILASMVPLDTLAWTCDPQFTAWYVSQFIFPGAILVLHGGSAWRSRNTAQVLTLLLADLQQRGYRSLTLSELLKMT